MITRKLQFNFYSHLLNIEVQFENQDESDKWSDSNIKVSNIIEDIGNWLCESDARTIYDSPNNTFTDESELSGEGPVVSYTCQIVDPRDKFTEVLTKWAEEETSFCTNSTEYARGFQNGVDRCKEILVELFDENGIKTYDVGMCDDEDGETMGFHRTYDKCLAFIKEHNTSDNCLFRNYKGGTASIIQNNTGECVYEEEIL